MAYIACSFFGWPRVRENNIRFHSVVVECCVMQLMIKSSRLQIAAEKNANCVCFILDSMARISARQFACDKHGTFMFQQQQYG